MKIGISLLGSLLLIGLLVSQFAGGHPPAVMAQPAPGWRAIGLDPREIAGSSGSTCFDPQDNNVLLYVEAQGQTTGGTSTYNWVTGQRTRINDRGFDLCGANGWLYANYPPRRFSPRTPTAQPLAYMPNYLATDGSDQVYRFEKQYRGNSQGRLWASADGGLTWEERAQEFKGELQGFAMTATDARSIYLLVVPMNGPGVPTVLFSSDAGATWEARGGVPAPAQDTLDLEIVPSRTAPPDMLALLTTIHEAGGDGLQYWVSINGGRAFRAVGTWDLEHHVRLLAPATGPLLRLDYARRAADPALFDHVLSRTTDGGYSWTPIPVPFPSVSADNWYNEYLAVASGNTDEIFITVADTGVWRSSDGGQTWAAISGSQGPFFYGTINEYWPPTLLGWTGTRGLYVWQPPIPPPGPSPFPPPPGTPASANDWRDTGIDLALTQPDHTANPVCFDARQPYVLLFNEAAALPGAVATAPAGGAPLPPPPPPASRGTVAYDWATGRRTLINPRSFDACGATGLLYARQPDGTAWRFSTADPVGRAIAHFPTHLAEDGSAWVYALAPYVLENGPGQSVLWASADGGLTWEERGQALGGRIAGLAVAEANARVLYAVTVEPAGTGPTTTRYTVYASLDAGRTWELRSSGSAAGNVHYAAVSLAVVPGHTAPLDLVELDVLLSYSGTTPNVDVYLSGDGGRNFNKVGERGAAGRSLQLVHTHEGILRLSTAPADPPTGPRLDLSMDGGRTWQPLDLPPVFAPPAPNAEPLAPDLTVARVAPANVFLHGSGLAYASADGGHTWQAATPGTEVRPFTPSLYLPLQVLRAEGSHLFARELPEAGRFQPARAPLPTSDAVIPGGLYIPQTGHTLRDVFKQYWDAHGGLGQFGYPRTDAFPEVNSADGRVYLTQYFERARMEYHPDFAGSPFEVELGLLGNEQTTVRRAAGEVPFNRVADPRAPDGAYFPATGHTLRGPFLAYWLAYGGLERYGYPISEEFAEVNPDDGQTYQVQYFERNRFEHHPTAPPEYQVLLGLLGNTLLTMKGWEP